MKRLALAALLMRGGVPKPARAPPDDSLSRSPTRQPIWTRSRPRRSLQKLHQLLYQLAAEDRREPEGRARPGCSIRHDRSATYIAEIPAGVRFHDGREMTSADVAFTFRRFLDPRLRPRAKGAYPR
jgi:hypothetical protein